MYFSCTIHEYIQFLVESLASCLLAFMPSCLLGSWAHQQDDDIFGDLLCLFSVLKTILSIPFFRVLST